MELSSEICKYSGSQLGYIFVILLGRPSNNKWMVKALGTCTINYLHMITKLAIFLALVAFSMSAQIEGCTGEAITFPLIDEEPTLVESTSNGKKFAVGICCYNADYDGRSFLIVSVKGTAYEMGYAYGRLLQSELKVMVKDFFGWAAGYIANNVTQLSQLPTWLRNEIGRSGVSVVKRLLDLNYLITKKFTPARWDQEFKGIADASGISVKTWRRINLIPEILKASCSIGGWWGPATASGQLIQLRALDWEEHAPISKFPLITVYHPTEEGSVPFANIAWVGFLGSLTGYSSAKIGVSERLRGGPADTMTRFGKPWTYALRDVLQFSKTIDDALNNLNQTNRTCSVYLGIGSSVNNTYRLIEYSEMEFNVYNDKTWHQDVNHPRTEGMIWKVNLILI